MTNEKNNFVYAEGIFGKDVIKTFLNRLGVSDTLYVDKRGVVYLKKPLSPERSRVQGNFYSDETEYQVISHVGEDKLNAPLIRDRIGELEKQFGEELVQKEVLRIAEKSVVSEELSDKKFPIKSCLIRNDNNIGPTPKLEDFMRIMKL